MRALALCLLFASTVAAAQPQKAPAAPPAKPPATPPVAPAAKPPVTPPAAPAQPPAVAKPPVESYSYNPDGRRDPFVGLIGVGLEPAVMAKKGEGAASLMVAEISVRGVMQSRTGLIAMVQGPDNKTYIVHSGDRFADGTIRSVTPQGLVIIQEVNDPLSLVKQREIRKLLRSLEDAKE